MEPASSPNGLHPRTAGQPGPRPGLERTLAAARDYFSRGWRVIPVGYRTKHAAPNGWKTLRLQLEDLEREFGNRPSNLGVVLGAASNGLVDVDLDHPAAIELADQYLPPTGAIFGRSSKPRSHRLYRLKQLVRKRTWTLSPTCRTELVGLRSTDHYSVFPASVHPSGEPVEWVVFEEPAEMDAEELIASLDRLARAARGALGLPPECSRPNKTAVHRPASCQNSSLSVGDRMQRYGRAAMEKELATLEETPEGGRNNQLFQSAIALGQLVAAGAVDLGQAEGSLQSSAEAAGLSAGEARATIASGLSKGVAEPRDLSFLQTSAPEERTFRIGNATLRPGPPRLAPSGKLQLEVELVIGGARKLISLTSAASNRKAAAKTIQRLASGVDLSDIDDHLSEVLLWGRDEAKRFEATAAGPTIAELLQQLVPPMLGLVFRHPKGLWSEHQGELLNRARFVDLVPRDEVLHRLTTAVDVPLHPSGRVNRPTLLSRVAREAAVLFANQMGSLPQLEHAAISETTTPRLRLLIRHAILESWVLPQVGGILLRPVQHVDQAVQVTERRSLVEAIREQISHASPNEGTAGSAAKSWRQVRSGFAAWWRSDSSGAIWLAMRHDLCSSCRVRVPMVEPPDPRIFAVVGRKLGLFLKEEDSPVPSTQGHLKQRILVLQQELSSEILARAGLT